MHVGNLLDLAGLMAIPWRSDEALRRIQERRLRRVVRHAAQHVPFYRELLRSHGIDPREIRTAADLRAIPPVSKRELQATPLAERIAGVTDIQTCHSQTTSGSTGVPLEVYVRNRDETVLNLGWVRAFLSAGLRPWEKRAVFTPKREVTGRRSWYEHLGLMRRLDVSTWSAPETWLDEMTRFRPHAIMGYVKVMQLFAETVRERGADGITPRLVFTTSEMLDDASRAVISAAFGVPVVNIYASAEAGCVAWECMVCRALHVAMDTVVLEILREDGSPAGPGEVGEVVVTNLHSYAMPFIRYRQGDLAAWASAKGRCGRNLPLLAGIQGRQDDCVVLRDGRSISYSPFYYSVQSAPGVRRWKVTQEDLDTLLVEIEPGPLFDADARQRILHDLRCIVGDQMTISISIVHFQPWDPRSKFRAVSSKVRRVG